MVRIRTRIHDKFSLEFKIWYDNKEKHTPAAIEGNSGVKPLLFRQECWIFVPAALDINALTYSREQFYSDITTYYRAITPVYTLRELATGGGPRMDPDTRTPLGFLSNAIHNLADYPTEANIAEYEYQIKMYCAIFKSAVRERYTLVKLGEDTIESFREDLLAGLTGYGSLRESLKGRIEDKLYDYYAFGEEFIINLAQMYTHKIYANVGKGKDFIAYLALYKQERGYSALQLDSEYDNANLLYRWNVLKKYVESDLFLSADKRRSGVLKEQVYYSIAAGLSMIFATAVTFTFQQKYGNFTMPLFVALVVSYMLKDRIKELVRSAFASNRKLRYFDNKTLLWVKDTLIGRSREGFDFIPQSKVPSHILDIRNRSTIVDVENRMNQESVLFYRTLVELDKVRLDSTSEYEIDGINKIFLFNFSSFIKKMDNPKVNYPLYKSDGEIVPVTVKKIYYVNFIFQFTCNGEVINCRYRIMMNREGILNLEEL